MSSFETGLLMGIIVGVCLAYAGIIVWHWWADHQTERVELDEAWVRFKGTRIP